MRALLALPALAKCATTSAACKRARSPSASEARDRPGRRRRRSDAALIVPALASALTAAAVMALPPMRPRTIRYGTPRRIGGERLLGFGGADEADRECRGSPPAAARPSPASRAGGTARSARCRWRPPRPSSRSRHSSSAAAERVVPSFAASAGTRGSRSVQITSLPAGSRARVTPCATISASHRIGAPRAQRRRAPRRPGPARTR